MGLPVRREARDGCIRYAGKSNRRGHPRTSGRRRDRVQSLSGVRRILLARWENRQPSAGWRRQKPAGRRICNRFTLSLRLSLYGRERPGTIHSDDALAAVKVEAAREALYWTLGVLRNAPMPRRKTRIIRQQQTVEDRQEISFCAYHAHHRLLMRLHPRIAKYGAINSTRPS